jgi:hypothetical protein
MGLPNMFNDIIQKDLNVFAAWVPVVNKFSLGDYGIFADGVFSKLGNIKEDFGITFKESPGTEANIDYTSEGANIIKGGAKGGVTEVPGAEIKASIQIEFTKERSFLVKSPTISVVNIDDVQMLGKKLATSKDWDGKWKVVYQVYNAIDAVIVSTIEAGTKLDFNGDATAIGKMNLGSAGINIDTNKTLGLKINGKSGVIGLGLFRVKSSLFGGKKVEILGEEKIGEDNSVIVVDPKKPVTDDV